MKKRLLISLFTILFLLVGCGSAKYANSKYLGTWKATQAEAYGVSISTESLVGEFSMDLKEDGSAKVTIDKDTYKGDWEEIKNGIQLKDSKDTRDFKAKDGHLILEYSGATITFEKQK